MLKQKIMKILACVGVCASLAGCSYTGRANMKINPNGNIELETLWLVEKPDTEGSMKWSGDAEENPYSLLKPIDPTKNIQLIEEVEREVNGKTMVGWHLHAGFTTKGYQAYYKALLPTVGSETEVQETGPLTGEIVTSTEVIEGEDVDLNDGKIHTISVANFAPKVQVKSSGFKKQYYISYVGILDSVPEEYREYIKDGLEFSIAPCGEVLEHNATEVSENGIYTWKNDDINNLQIIFEYTDLYPIITLIEIAGVTGGAYLVAYLLIRFWTRPSQLYGYNG